MECHFIINPNAGNGAALNYISCIKAAGQNNISVLSSKKEAVEYAGKIAESGKISRIYAVGGDGTLNGIINGTYGYGNIEIGIIPAGSGNDFVRCFNDKNRFRDLKAQLDGIAVSVDIIKAKFDNGIETYFINMSNIGFDCNAVINAEIIKKKYHIGSASYYIGVFQEFFKKWGQDVRVVFDDGDVYEGKQLLCTIANGQYCGGGFCSSPKACLNDGYIDVAIINKVSRGKMLSLFRRYRDGTYLEDTKLERVFFYKKTKHLKIEMDKEYGISVDGEIYYFKTAEFNVLNRGIRLVIPNGVYFN